MSAHTPMQWFIDVDGNRILATDSRQTIICHLSASTRNPEVMADARIIAAAPQMLEALLDCRRALEIANFSQELQVVDAAIAKATGES